MAKLLEPSRVKSLARRRLMLPVCAYVRLSREPITETAELVKDCVFVDYDKDGNVVGVEVLK